MPAQAFGIEMCMCVVEARNDGSTNFHDTGIGSAQVKDVVSRSNRNDPITMNRYRFRDGAIAVERHDSSTKN
ncbi:MAG: hypothetical protein AB7O79_15910 [Xanthobacteraceae bacterium]